MAEGGSKGSESQQRMAKGGSKWSEWDSTEDDNFPLDTIIWNKAREDPSFREDGLSNSRSVELKEEDLLMVRLKTPQSNVDEKDEKIPKWEAVCKFCSGECEDNVLKTKCRCKGIILMHENCAIQAGNVNCAKCEQDIRNIPVTLSRPDKEKPEKPASSRNRSHKWIRRLRNMFCC